MDEALTLDDVRQVIERILARVTRLVVAGRRDMILNERFFHHMFSWEVGRVWQSRSSDQSGDFWDALYLTPEAKTTLKFRRKSIRLGDVTAPIADAINTGRSGNLDFVLRSNPPISVEWKGPKLYTVLSAFEVLLKLLKEPPGSIKVFAAIITSSSQCGRGHVAAAKQHLELAARYARDAHGTSDLQGQNLYAFIASVAANTVETVHWGALH